MSTTLARRCLLHVGMPKTASTSIQRAFTGFDDGRWLYPELGQSHYFGYNHGGPLFTLYSTAPELHIIHRVEGRGTAEIAALKSELTPLWKAALAREDRNLFLSGEMLSASGPDDPFHTPLWSDLQPHFERVDVLAFLRPFRSFMTSWYQQRLHRAPLLPEPAQVVPNYRWTVGLWSDAIPEDHIRLLPFHRERDPVMTMAGEIGVTGPASRRENVARCLEATAILYAYKRLGFTVNWSAGATAALRAVQDRIARIGRGVFVLPASITEPLAETHRPDIHWIAERMRIPTPRAREFLDDRSFGSDVKMLTKLDDLLDIASAQLQPMRALVPAFTPPSGDDVTKVCACLEEMYRRAMPLSD